MRLIYAFFILQLALMKMPPTEVSALDEAELLLLPKAKQLNYCLM
jgi:hypothetical protein